MKTFFCRQFLLFLLLFNCLAIAQNKSKLDSLFQLIQQAKADTNKVNLLLKYGLQLSSSDPTKAIVYGYQTIQLANKLSRKKNVADAHLLIGTNFKNTGAYDSALVHDDIGFNLMKTIDNKAGMSRALNNIGIVYKEKGELKKALDYYFKSISLLDEAKEKKAFSRAYLNIGNVYRQMRNSAKALEYQLKAAAISEETNDQAGLAKAYANIGNIYSEKGDQNKTLEYYIKSKVILEKLQDKATLGVINQSIGNVYYSRKNYSAAEKYFEYSKQILKEVQDVNGYARGLTSLAMVYSLTGKNQKAIDCILESIEIGTKTGNLIGLKEAYKSAAEVYAASGNHEQANFYLTKYVSTHDSLLSMEANKQMGEFEQKYQNEKKQKEIELLKKSEAIHNLEIKRQNTLLIFGSTVLIIVIVLGFFIYKNLREKKKANRLLSSQNNEIQKQKTTIEEKNKDIIDSIRYAEKLQSTILPSENTIKAILPNSFVLFKPKDIVSGDFYFIEEIEIEKKQFSILATVDCTGHGVPGAMMSIVGHNLINHIVREKKIVQPNLILNELLHDLNKALARKNDQYTSNDGMDISICLLNYATNELQYAGAFNPLVLISEGKLTEFKGDKFSIGRHGVQTGLQFKNNIIHLKKGDQIYLSSDGYADQFGGEKSKKLMRKNFHQLLLKISTLEMNAQKNELLSYFDNWKGVQEQVDDVCIIGVRI